MISYLRSLIVGTIVFVLTPQWSEANGAIPSASNATPEDLGNYLNLLHKRQGVSFKAPADILHDRITFPKTLDTTLDLHLLLKGYNWIGLHDVAGVMTSVIITGRNGDGSSFVSENQTPPLFKFRSPPKSVPEKYRGYPQGSVYPIEISGKQLRGMALGDHLLLNLPAGDHAVVHDNAWNHSNGDVTWIGKEASVKGLFRTSITLGEQDHIDGQIVTADGTYLLESDQNGQWLIDIKATGFQQGNYDQGGVPPIIPAVSATVTAAGESTRIGSGGGPGFTNSKAGSPTNQIDLLMLYSDDFSVDSPLTRLNSLLAFANQAMMDSKVNVRFSLVGTKKIDYPSEGQNLVALNQLTVGQGVFKDIDAKRESLGADLVLLMRPFNPSSKDSSCGDAWINGGSGSGFSADLAYGVVNDGRARGFYCSNYTLAHELGHLLGSAHDRRHSISPGHFPYSYGYGIQGVFGDIMSYDTPEVGLYSNPDLFDCAGQRCGIAIGKKDEADASATFNSSGAVVAKFASPPSH